MTFYKTKKQLLQYIWEFDAKKYWSTRNSIPGGVSQLSPYITHGIITIPECIDHVLQRRSIQESEKFLMELVWKEFFMHVQQYYWNWFTNNPVREDKTHISKKLLLPEMLIAWTTHTKRVNSVVEELHTTWRLHNHKRMRLASWCCHWAKLDWKKCADRTYYHFIDGELAPNYLSWQWVNSTFANKAYIMNEDNLQRYRPWAEDTDLRWSYEQISEKIFNEDRLSKYRDEKDMCTSLITPVELLDTYSKDMLWTVDKVRILSPWKLAPECLQKDIPTLVVLDKTFTSMHPRSKKRLEFIKLYTDNAWISFVCADYDMVIQDGLTRWKRVIIDERFDPVYTDVYKKYQDNESIEIIPYELVCKVKFEEPVMKFFNYWKKTLPFIKQRT